METESESHTRPTAGRLILYFFFAWLISIVCGFSSTTTAICFFNIRPDHGFSFGTEVIGLALAVLGYGTGAFVLGTLTRQRVKAWTAAIVYVIPSFFLRGLIFAGAYVSDPIKEELLANPIPMIVMPVVYLLVSPFVAFYFLRMGEDFADVFSQPNSALNVSWKHWLWVLPFFLFQVIGVPLYLVLTLWKIDFLMADIPFSFFSLPSLIIRIIVFVILTGILTAIKSAYTALSENLGSTGIRIIKVIGTWVLLTVIQTLIILSGIGKYMD
jgi:hypothetical protein